MGETLIIRNFGPIKDVELDLKRFNVIIGENATGKSTIAKVLAVCRYFSFVIKTQFGIEDVFKDDDGGHFLDGLESWGINEFLTPKSEIDYINSDYSLSVSFKFNKPKIKDDEYGPIWFQGVDTKLILKPLSVRFKNLLRELDKIKPDKDSLLKGWNVPTSFFQNDVTTVMENPFFVPTERGLQSIFSLGKNSIQNIADSLFNQLANLDLIAKNFKTETKIEPLDISYKNVDGKGYIKKEGKHEFLSLYNGASGYKSAIPVVLVIKYYNDIRKKHKTFIVEEPELNLFPTAQYSLVKFLIERISTSGNSLLMTTHSPYILTSINNLLQAHVTGSKNKNSTKVSKIINKKSWVNPEDISAYMLLPNGKCESIFDNKEKLIKAEMIDSVSTILNKEFDEILRIEFDIKKRKENV